jgi:peptidoglycan/LPS O-acetylase OafA/YrhL
VKSSRLEGLDALRGAAAISIAVFHTVMLSDPNASAWLPQWFKDLYLAVPVFYAISAFSLSVAYAGKLSSTAQLKHFYLRRFLRIAPLYYAMVVAWILALSYLWGAWQLPSLVDLALNVSFLFNLVPGKHISLVPAGWSMGPEMMFYAAFPFIAAKLSSIQQAAIGLAIASSLAIVAGVLLSRIPGSYDWMFVISQAPFFVSGVLMFHIFKSLEATAPKSPRNLVIAFVLSIAALLGLQNFADAGQMNLLGWNYRAHLVSALAMPLVLAAAIWPIPLLVNRATVFIGRVSYGIYLIHPLMIVLMGRPLFAAMEGQLQLNRLAVSAAAVLASSILLATATYYGFERRLSLWKPKLAADDKRAAGMADQTNLASQKQLAKAQFSNE